MKHLEGLNEAQKQAVLHTTGPLLILAGAGAGKTRVITHRIAHLIQEGVAPEAILAVTFTNKAAREMRERVDETLSGDTEFNFPVTSRARPFVSTFHSLGVSILRENARALGLPRHFKIYDRGESTKAVKDAITEAGYDPKQHEPRKVLGTISKQKGAGITWQEYQADAGTVFYPRLVATVWQIYDRTLKEEKALDFDDLLLRTMLLLRSTPEIRQRYNNQWQYIHIDEYQDTNAIQYELTKLLAGDNTNICVVGDIDQNIYSWRGADIENIFLFEKDFPGTKTVLLEQNYRSTKTILELANDTIKKNSRRKEKSLFTNNEDGEEPTLYCAFDEHDEARFVAETTEELLRDGVPPKEIAVLYRANFQSRVLEDMFLYYNIPYKVVGTKFFDRKEVKDVIAFLSAALNPESRADIKRIINVPARGIGKVTLLKLFEGKRDELTPAIAEKVNRFYALLSSIKEQSERSPISETIKHILTASGLEAHYKKGGTEEDIMRLENMRELVTLAARYDKLEPSEGLQQFLDDVALASDQDSVDEKANAVHLMTVHAAKGLEFDHVFITGLEAGLFPHDRFSEDDEDDDEEERRLFYVALTRARKKLYLTFAATRTIFGSRQTNIASEFITEIDESRLSVPEGGESGKTVYLE